MGKGGKGSQERPRRCWPGARELQVDSRAPGKGKKAGESGGAQTIGPAGGREPGAGRERRGRECGPGTRQSPGPVAASYRLGLLSAQQPGSPGPSRGASRQPARASSASARAAAGEGAGAKRAGPAAPRPPEETRGRSRVRALKPARGPLPLPLSLPHRRRHSRRRRRRRPALTRRRPGTSAARDAPEAGWASSRDVRGPGSRGPADWRTALEAGLQSGLGS